MPLGDLAPLGLLDDRPGQRVEDRQQFAEPDRPGRHRDLDADPHARERQHRSRRDGGLRGSIGGHRDLGNSLEKIHRSNELDDGQRRRQGDPADSDQRPRTIDPIGPGLPSPAQQQEQPCSEDTRAIESGQCQAATRNGDGSPPIVLKLTGR